MESVKDVGCYVNCRVEAECYVRAVDIVVDGLGKSYYVESLVRKQLGGLVCAVSAEGQKAVQLLLLVGLFHVLDLVDIVLADDLHHLEGLALCAEDSSALCQYSRKG